MADIGLSFAKFVVFIFNVIFSLLGASIIGIGIFIKLGISDYSIFLDKYLTAFFYVAIGIGCVIIFISCLGWYGAITENTCLLLSFSIIMMVAFSLQLAVGVFVIDKSNELEEIVEKGLNDTFYGIKDDETLYAPWDLIQNEFECCGVNGPSDWKAITGDNESVPSSCCQRANPSTCLIADASQEGCRDSLIDFIDIHLVAIVSIGFGVAVFQILGIVFSCCMFSVYRKRQHRFVRI